VFIKPIDVLMIREISYKKRQPWLVSTAAYIPIVVFALGTNAGLPKVHTVERNVAHAKLLEFRHNIMVM
jgi:uncharacterized membrane protein (DUF2068 family)